MRLNIQCVIGFLLTNNTNLSPDCPISSPSLKFYLTTEESCKLDKPETIILLLSVRLVVTPEAPPKPFFQILLGFVFPSDSPCLTKYISMFRF